MNKTVSIEIKGMEKLKRMMARSPGVIAERLNRAIRLSIWEIQRNIIPLTPVISGTLQKSIKHGTSFGHLQGKISPTVKYAYFVHEGHRQEVGRYVPAIGKRLVSPYVKGKPFMKQGLEQSRDTVENIFNKEIIEATKDITR